MIAVRTEHCVLSGTIGAYKCVAVRAVNNTFIVYVFVAGRAFYIHKAPRIIFDAILFGFFTLKNTQKQKNA